jgi:hypothetical protein
VSLVENERLKLTAGYLNAGAGSCFAAGVVAPVAALTFGYGTAQAGLSPLTFAVGITTFLATSLALHAAARFLLKELKS